MYRSANAYLRRTFGRKIYRLSLSAGCTCPNRDGSIGTRGCIFCNGSGDFASDSALGIRQQIEQAKSLVSAKAHDAGYIAYFQDHTNTYGSVERLEALFSEALRQPEIVALSVATRPDCLPEQILAMLKRLRRIAPVWVELGLQTVHESSARYIRRGYPLSVYEQAVRALKAADIGVITHMILGLPGESAEQMIETARYIGKSGADGIKLHLLHVLRDTDLAKDYAAGLFETMSMDEYITVVRECLRVLPPDMVIHRLTGDGAKRSLLAPEWSADKKKVLNEMRRRFAAEPFEQGELFFP